MLFVFDMIFLCLVSQSVSAALSLALPLRIGVCVCVLCSPPSCYDIYVGVCVNVSRVMISNLQRQKKSIQRKRSVCMAVRLNIKRLLLPFIPPYLSRGLIRTSNVMALVCSVSFIHVFFSLFLSFSVLLNEIL